MPRKRVGQNPDADNKVFTFRLDRRREDERKARQLLETWLAEERQKPHEDRRELRDIITALVLNYSGDTALVSAGGSNKGEFQAIKGMLREVLTEVRNRNPKALQQFAAHASSDAPLDDEFIDNLMEGWDK